ncbi:MAG: maleylpyruvate isomerase N-terminal domain-containing protein [Chloroflexota bacterium]
MDERQSLQPVLVVDLFPELLAGLISLLTDLSEEDWLKPTVCAPWTVKDVAFHLLGGDIGYLSWQRDEYSAFPEINSWEHLVELINQQNDRWFQTGYRFSTQLLLELLQFTGEKFTHFIASVDPFEMSNPVEWVGPDPAPKWVDIAREYTERWHHQQHIRDAVGKHGFNQPRFLTPVLDTFMLAVPQTFNQTQAETGTIIQIDITGPAGRNWILEKLPDRWALTIGESSGWQAKVELDEDTAWRVFTRGIEYQDSLSKAVIQGNQPLGQKVLQTVSIIA